MPVLGQGPPVGWCYLHRLLSRGLSPKKDHIPRKGLPLRLETAASLDGPGKRWLRLYKYPTITDA